MTTTTVDVSDVQTHEAAPGWIEAAAPVTGHCTAYDSYATVPAWDRVQQDQIKGVYDDTGGCRGCGSYGCGWVSTGARKTPAHPDDLAAFTAALKVEAAGMRDQGRAQAVAQIRADLAGRLEGALGDIPGGLDDETGRWSGSDEDWAEWVERHSVGEDPASDEGPVFFSDEDGVTAWAAHPWDQDGPGIEVTESDLPALARAT